MQFKSPFELDKYTAIYYKKRLRWAVVGFLSGILLTVAFLMIFFWLNKPRVCAWFKCQTPVIQSVVKLGCGDDTDNPVDNDINYADDEVDGEADNEQFEQLSQQELEWMQAEDQQEQTAENGENISAEVDKNQKVEQANDNQNLEAVLKAANDSNQQLDEQSGDQTQQLDEANSDEANSTYQIKKGDCLWDIAEEQLGDASRWVEIYELNKDVIGSNPDLIYPQVVLELPGS